MSSVKVKDKPSRRQPAAENPVPAPAAPAVHPAIALDPVDWFWAPWRRCPPLVRPAPLPFDPEDCAARWQAARVGRPSRRFGQRWDWKRAAIAPALTPEEARFWFEAMLPNGAAEKPAHPQPQRPLEQPEIVARLRENVHALRAEILLPLAHFLSPEACIELLLAEDLVPAATSNAPGTSRFVRAVLREGFRRYLLPYLDGPQCERLRALLRGRLDPDLWPTEGGDVPVVFSLAAALGMRAELRSLVESWPDVTSTRRTFVFQNNERQNVIFGLDGPEEVLLHLRRLRLRPLQPEHARAWLAHFELDALDWIRDTIQALPSKEQATRVLEVLCLVKAPEAAPHLLELKRHSQAPRLARQWLDEHVSAAVAGLVAVAAGRGDKAEAALEYLADVRRQGHVQLLEGALRSLPPAGADRLRRSLLAGAVEDREPLSPEQTPDWLRAALAAVPAGKKERLPEWLRVDRLPPLVVGDPADGRCLAAAQVEAVLAALRRTALADPHPLVRAVRQHGDPASLDVFGWKLFQAWLDDGVPPAGNWALNALGLLGGDDAVAKFMPLLPTWKDAEGSRRAATGLECLAAIGSDTALQHLQRSARDATLKGLQHRAGELLGTVAARRGLTREQLEDRIVPGLGADAGGAVFDFGPRQFRLSLGLDLKPRLRDEAGRLKAQLPDPGPRDDAHKAEVAGRRWQALKQHLRETVKIQTQRLEEAMVAGRRWQVGAFESLLGHPVLGPLARRLVWGGFDRSGRLVCCFRIAEEGCCVGLQEEACPAEEVHAVGIVHPVHLTEGECLAWREALGAGDMSQPFPQLERRVEVSEPDEEDQPDITRFAELGIPASFLWRLLQRQGWKRGGYELGVAGWAYVKPFSGAGVTAVFELADAGPGRSSSGRPEVVCVRRAYFLDGLPARTAGFTSELPLGRVDRAVLSEVLSDLKVLASKGQVVEAPPPPPQWRAPRPALRPAPRVQMVASAVAGTAFGGEDEIPF